MTASPLPDGTYGAIVVDASEGSEGTTALELAVLAGAYKGEVVALQGPAGADPLDLLGLPATITVAAGQPQVRLEP